MPDVRIGIIGDFDDSFPPHLQTNEALCHTASALGISIDFNWLPTDELHDYSKFDALWCAPGSPYKSMQGALKGIRFAREHHLPLLGTCGGFQHVVVEYARNVMAIRDAAHAEYDPYASQLFVQPLSCSLRGQTMTVQIEPDSLAARSYGCLLVEESYYCDFGLNPTHQEELQCAGLTITGQDLNHEARIVELRTHCYFLATLFVPQARSRPGAPHPLIRTFIISAVA
ncbi:MAG TPA: hypothetical protein VMF56_04865 [Acidobacteriaceae bacterium]|nr:hypothetical protein [Acidobacteriaceae bacterium]